MSQDIAGVVISLLRRSMKESDRSRVEIAADMSAITGFPITKFMIDAWTAKAKGKWRFPLEYAPAFELATGSRLLSGFLAHCADGEVTFGRDVELLEIVKVQKQIQELEAQKAMLFMQLEDAQ
jgi:hypothetical protein